MKITALVCVSALMFCLSSCCDKNKNQNSRGVSTFNSCSSTSSETTTKSRGISAATTCTTGCAVKNIKAEQDSWDRGPKAAHDNVQRQMAQDKIDGKWHWYYTDGSVGPEVDPGHLK